MAGDRRLFDDMTRAASGAASALSGIRSRMESELRDQAERLLRQMNLVTREEHETVAALAAKARAEQEILAERLAALEAKLSTKPVPRKAAAAAKRATPAKSPKAKASQAKPTTTRRKRGGA